MTSQLLSAAPQIDAIWNHDDDQGVGVLAAIDAAGRDEFFMVGGAGSKNAMDAIKAGDSVLEATVIYPSTQAADGIRLARLIAQGKALGDLVEVDVPDPHRAQRAGRDGGERRPVPADRLRVLSAPAPAQRRHQRGARGRPRRTRDAGVRTDSPTEADEREQR